MRVYLHLPDLPELTYLYFLPSQCYEKCEREKGKEKRKRRKIRGKEGRESDGEGEGEREKREGKKDRGGNIEFKRRK